MLKRIIERTVRCALDAPKEGPGKLNVHSANSILENIPMGMIVHPISNGYIMRVEKYDNTRVEAQVTLTFAADEKGIAEEIIAAQARLKLDVSPKQGELFKS